MKMVNILGLTVINTKVYVYVIAMLCYVYTIALSNASQVIVGFLMGAKREDEVTNQRVAFYVFSHRYQCRIGNVLLYNE